MKLAIPKERMEGEPRVAASPETVKKYTALGFDVVVEIGAGAGSHISDEEFKEAGASIAASSGEAISDAVAVFAVRALDD